MKATVWDVDVLSHLQPLTVEAYLQATGWHERNRIPDKVSIWTRDTFNEDQLKIQLPLYQEFDDFPRRMSEVLETLELAENRSQLDIVSELITTAPNLQIQGIVMQLQQPGEEASGKVTILGVVVDKLRKINLYLREPDYTLAVKAYQERLPVFCTGDLIKEGDTFVLKNPRNLALDEKGIN